MEQKNPYNLEVGTVYFIDHDKAIFLLHNVAKAPRSGYYYFHLTFMDLKNNTTSECLWHQYQDYSKLINLKKANKVLQILYGKTNS